jgi:DNA-binding HxlR family transcriptional regulator
MQALVRKGLPMELDMQLQNRHQWVIGDACSMTRVLELLSTKTAFQVIRELFLGTTRFDDFVDRVGTTAPAVSRALKQLESAQIVDRAAYQEPGRRARDEYRLTQAGEDLLPVFLSLVQWGDTHLQNGKPPLSFVDAGTGQRVGVRVTADTDGADMRSSDIRVRRSR